MNYRLIRNVKVKGRFFPLGAFAFFLCALFLFHFLYPSALGGLASRLALPFWDAERFVTDETHSLLLFFSSKDALTKDVERLTAELEDVHRLLADRDLLAEQNRMLKEEVGRTVKTTSRVTGAILATPPRSPYDTAVIDIGTSDGVFVGNLVLSGFTMLGVVGKVYAHTSLVEFFSTAGRKTPVSILHAGTVIPAEAVGEGGGAFKATLPKEVTIERGDSVSMPGLNPLAFATVEAIESSVTDSFQVVRFKNPLSLGTLRVLEVELSSGE